MSEGIEKLVRLSEELRTGPRVVDRLQRDPQFGGRLEPTVVIQRVLLRGMMGLTHFASVPVANCESHFVLHWPKAPTSGVETPPPEGA
jgi:hypothetical protein